MISELFTYLIVFGISVVLIFAFQKIIRIVHIKTFGNGSKTVSAVIYCIIGCIFLLPILTMYGLRYGIGTDYFNYENIYNTIHNSGLMEYWSMHLVNAGGYYVEPGYYLLNVISPSYRVLLWIVGIIIFVIFLMSIRKYYDIISLPFSLLVFLSTQFIYSMNVVRFTIAVMLVLLAYVFLIEDKLLGFIVVILVATLFHKTALLCLAFVFLKQFKNDGVNRIRNILMFMLIISLPLLAGFFFEYLKDISVLSRYFSVSQYEATEVSNVSWTWLLHIVPVYLPIVFICRKELFKYDDSKTLFRIAVMEVPFRIIGLYNTYYTRMARYSQIVQVVLIPLIVSRVENKKTRVLLYLYYIIWYVFYFGYYAIVNDQGDSLPYVWILSQM